MLYFAYGANINKETMKKRCPHAVPIGPALLPQHQFFINDAGWASVEPQWGHNVHGILWEITQACEQTLDLQEQVHLNLYHKEQRFIEINDGSRQAMIYIAQSVHRGISNPGYLERIVHWAGEWQFPQEYIHLLQTTLNYRKMQVQ